MVFYRAMNGWEKVACKCLQCTPTVAGRLIEWIVFNKESCEKWRAPQSWPASEHFIPVIKNTLYFPSIEFQYLVIILDMIGKSRVC